MAWWKPGQFLAAGHQTNTVALADTKVSKRGSQDNAVLLSRFEAAARLDTGLQVEEDPPIC